MLHLPSIAPALLLICCTGFGSCSQSAQDAKDSTEVFRFVHWPYRDACWRLGRSPECCLFEREAVASVCWDDFWTPARCCSDVVQHEGVPEAECVTTEPLLRPSPHEAPFIFLWDEKAGGSTFNRWLLESVVEEGLLSATHISDFGWSNIIGSPYFLKLFDEDDRRNLAVVAGNFDWRVVEGMCLPLADTSSAKHAYPPQHVIPRRQVRCFVLLRDPVDRFISYWLERSQRRLELDGRRALSAVPLRELKEYLDSVRTDALEMTGLETGVGCNREAGLCMAPGPPEGALREEEKKQEQENLEMISFRMLGGPQNRLARMLDPSGGSHPRFEVAASRLQNCLVGSIARKHRNALREVLSYHLPWVREVMMTESSLMHPADVIERSTAPKTKPQVFFRMESQDSLDAQVEVQVPQEARDAKRNHWYLMESKWTRENLTSEARQLIAEYNNIDVPLYRLGMQIFRSQAAEAKLHRLTTQPVRLDESGKLVQNDIRLNITWLHSDEWRHHFESMGLHMTRFMTQGLTCLTTRRYLECARFLRMEWPDTQNGPMPEEQIVDLIRRFAPKAQAYLMELEE